VNLAGGAVDLVVVKNALFGRQVTVTGLLGGRDILAALDAARLAPATTVLIPDICLREGSFLDGLTFGALGAHFPRLTHIACPTQGRELARITKEE